MCGEQSPHIRLSGQDGKAPALHFRPRSVMAAGDFVLSDGCGRFRFKSNDEFCRQKSETGFTV
ncbi:hypothetical protein D3K98_15670 [Escherichia coli]|nr:hypothetical protein [Escherichia coli]EFO3036869.1 hypothetical protein [Escherichia coli]EGE0884380.1 hypothetical protein [Escherichia coli]RLX46297.1 hypothetical protein EAI56_13010 [Escherichia coli]